MAARTSRKSAKAADAGTNSEGRSGSKAEAQTAKPEPIDGARPEGTDAPASPPNPAETGQASAAAPGAAADVELPPGVTVTGQFNRADPATVTAVGALVQAALARGALPPGEATVLEGEQLAAFEVRSNVLGNHGLVEAGGTVIVNRVDFEALKAAGVIAGDWPEPKVSAG